MNIASLYKNPAHLYGAIILSLCVGLSSAASIIAYVFAPGAWEEVFAIVFLISGYSLHTRRYRLYSMQRPGLLAIESVLSFIMLIIMLVI